MIEKEFSVSKKFKFQDTSNDFYKNDITEEMASQIDKEKNPILHRLIQLKDTQKERPQ